jgi:hypothetical protein
MIGNYNQAPQQRRGKMFTKLERQRYNEDRERACKRLGITKNQYNWLRRKGEELRKTYEDECNGWRGTEGLEMQLIVKIRDYISSNKKLFVYLQTDPRGATIYLDTKKIPSNNYTQAVCIY